MALPLILGGMSLLSGLIGSRSASKAASTQANAAERSSAAQTAAADRAAQASLEAAKYQSDMALTGQRESIEAQKAALDQQIALSAPARAAGLNALSGMQQLARMKFDPGQYQASDAYKFQLSEGQNALGNLAASRGMSRSGAAMKDALRFSQGLASQDEDRFYTREYNDFNNRYNKLSGIANIGSGAQAQQIGAIQGSANNTQNALMQGYLSAGAANAAGAGAAANAYTNAGNAQAAGFMNAGNARASGYTNQGNAVQGMFGDAAGLLGMYQGGYFDNQKPLSGLFGGGAAQPQFGTRNLAGLY